MKNFIPYGKQTIVKDDKKAVLNIFKKNYLTTGPLVEKFENKFSKKINAKYSVCCSSGTAAIHIAFKAINLKQNDNIIIPSINFISAINLATLLKANIFLSDVDPITGQMSPSNLLDCIKKNKIKKVKAFMTMYNGGDPNNVKEFYKIKKKLKSYMIEDACHALGAKYSIKENLKVGDCKYSDIATFSFHPVKSITTGEGGMVTTNSKYFFNKFKILRNHGIERKKNTTKKYNWDYKITRQGFNYRLSDINCALGVSQLDKLDSFIKKRNKIANKYNKNFKKINNFIYTPVRNKNTQPAWHLYVIRINFDKLKVNRNYIMQRLYKDRIITQVHYIPVFFHNIYKSLKRDFLKGSLKYYNSCLSLPIYPSLSLKEVDSISEKIKNIIKKNTK